MDHPKVQLHMSVHAADCSTFNKSCPTVKPLSISVMADTGAQSCLWSMDDFLAVGFTNEDFIPVRLDLHVNGAIILHLQGKLPETINSLAIQ